MATTSLTPIERQVALLSVSFENDCRYCMAAHSQMALKAGAGKEMVDALRGGDPLPDLRLDALARFARALVRDRGWVGEDEVQGFLRAGFGKAQILEVLVAVATKTLSNYTNHLAHTELDEAARPFAWGKPMAAGGTTCPHP